MVRLPRFLLQATSQRTANHSQQKRLQAHQSRHERVGLTILQRGEIYSGGARGLTHAQAPAPPHTPHPLKTIKQKPVTVAIALIVFQDALKHLIV